MPTYVYACSSCGKQFEKFQSFKDAPLNTCLCGQEGTVRRVFQPVGIVFKGSGWYVTDSRGNNSAAAPVSETKGTEAKAGEVKAGESKTEKAETSVPTPTSTASSDS